MEKKRTKFWWAKPWLYGFWVALGAFAFMLIAKFGTELLLASQAATADTSGGMGFDAYLCSAITYANALIGILAVFTVTMAGISYMTSSGGKEGISTAKSMLMAAITGVLLYAFGNLLLGTCGTGAGGLISQYFN